MCNPVAGMPPDDSEEMAYVTKQCIQYIEAWKAHQLRSVQQDKCRADVLEQLSRDEVLITQDWAMKHLPTKFRETQADWFGKRGISWHISIVVTRGADGELAHQAFIHVVKNCTQDSSVVVALLAHTLETLKKEHPEIETTCLRQDNAGCYHSVGFLMSCFFMKEITGIAVRRADFNDPQGGKGPCDRKAASVKAHIRRYVNEGNGVTNAEEFQSAVLSNGGLQGVRIALVDGATVTPLPSMKWDGVSQYNNFEFSDDKLTAWKAYGIGSGKEISKSSLRGIFTHSVSQNILQS